MKSLTTTSLVLRESIPKELVVPRSALRLVLAQLTYFVMPVSLGIVGIMIVENPLPWSVYLGLGILAIVLIGFAFWMQLQIVLNQGIVIRPDGIAILRSSRHKKNFMQTFVPWQELTTVRVSGLFSEIVTFGKPAEWLRVDRQEARAILSDPRCPLYGKTPLRDQEKLRLRTVV